MRQFLYRQDVGRIIIAQDMMAENVEPVRPDTDLSSVMARFARCRYAQLPVVDSAGSKITGLVSRHEVVAAYDARLAAVRSRVPRPCPSASRSRLPRRLFPRG
ncbi:MAG: CBS domain-containing protein [Planctomycetes bacterium]|nr:CBS domain-containing protein [Planctomycetota bacterium]